MIISSAARAVWNAIRSITADSDRVGWCAVCGGAVMRDEPRLRFGGKHYHAGFCVESSPPAEQSVRQEPPALHDFDGTCQTSWLRPPGDLDLETVPALDAVVRELVEHGVQRVIIDLRALSFIDLSGVKLLKSLSRRAQRDGWELLLIEGNPTVRRVIELAGTRAKLPFTSPASLAHAFD
jgi:anti-anti-sigma factor